MEKQIDEKKRKKKKKKKGDRCVRIAKRKYDVWPSAYASGAVVKCRQGKIWKGLSEEELNEMIDEELDESLEEGIGDFIRKATLAGTVAAGGLSAPPTQASEPVPVKQVAEQGDEIKFDESTKILSVTLDVEEGDNGEFAESQARDLADQWKEKNGYAGFSYEGKKVVKGNRFNPERIAFMFQMQKALEEKKKKKPDFKKEKESGLHGWFSRQGGKGKSKGWVDCNTCRKDKKTGKKTCKTCGRKEGEKRAKYPSCRPKPSDCGSSGKGKDWGKKSAKKEALQKKENLLELLGKDLINEN